MMQELLQNKLLMCSLIAWAAAQIIKFLLYSILNRSLDLHRLFGDGGMPSGHSATVTALAVSAGLEFGLSSFPFALSAIFAVVVMHDAMGVRQESGKHAKAINELIELLQPEYPMLPEEKLKEFLGHTPLQVLCGSILGALTAWLFYLLIP